MPSNQTPLGALPSRFRRERLLIIGCGDIGLRTAALQVPHVRVLALTSSASRVNELRRHGITPLLGDLDRPASLSRLAGLATRVVHLAPPAEVPGQWWRDLRTAALMRALARRSPPAALLYASTTGVYGDCEGQWVPETRTPAPATPRAHRRADAEAQVRHAARRSGTRASILRVPGIYAADRPRGTPRERLLRGTPVLVAQDDVFTNHIHADDLARAVSAALWRGRPQRVYNVSDDSQLKMGDYFDAAADHYGLARPPRIARSAAPELLPMSLLSFMGESRRLMNQRLKRELRFKLRHPDVVEALRKAP